MLHMLGLKGVCVAGEGQPPLLVPCTVRGLVRQVMSHPLYHPTLGWTAIKKKKRLEDQVEGVQDGTGVPRT